MGFAVITGSVALVAEMKGNRLNYYVKCVDDPDGAENTQTHCTQGHAQKLFIELSLIDVPRFCALA